MSKIVWADYVTGERSGQLYWDIQEQGFCPELPRADSVLFACDLSHPSFLYSWCSRHPSLLFAVVYQKAPKGRAQWVSDLFLEHHGKWNNLGLAEAEHWPGAPGQKSDWGF